MQLRLCNAYENQWYLSEILSHQDAVICILMGWIIDPLIKIKALNHPFERGKKTPLNAWQFALKIFFAKREEGATHKLNGFLNDNFCHKSVRFRGAQVQVQPCLVGARNVFLLQIWLTGGKHRWWGGGGRGGVPSTLRWDTPWTKALLPSSYATTLWSSQASASGFIWAATRSCKLNNTKQKYSEFAFKKILLLLLKIIT